MAGGLCQLLFDFFQQLVDIFADKTNYRGGYLFKTVKITIKMNFGLNIDAMCTGKCGKKPAIPSRARADLQYTALKSCENAA